MINSLKKLFGFVPEVNYADLIQKGAIVVDVRSKDEYSNGHVNGSINIPVGSLSNNLAQLTDKSKTIITCCSSGVRSASAKNILKSNGYTSVYNGGGWNSLNTKIKKQS